MTFCCDAHSLVESPGTFILRLDVSMREKTVIHLFVCHTQGLEIQSLAERRSLGRMEQPQVNTYRVMSKIRGKSHRLRCRPVVVISGEVGAPTVDQVWNASSSEARSPSHSMVRTNSPPKHARSRLYSGTYSLQPTCSGRGGPLRVVLGPDGLHLSSRLSGGGWGVAKHPPACLSL